MERAAAEAIYDAGREAVVDALVVLAAQVKGLLEANRALTERVERLEEQARRSSRNSSLPPSSDPPGTPGRPSGKGSGRRPGGQPGHPGTTRMLAGPERVDEVVEHWPQRCAGCGGCFADAEAGCGEPLRHQVSELPVLAVTVTEHRLHACRCECGRVTRAELPAGVSRSRFGPRLQAAAVTLCTRQRLSRRQVAELLGELFGCPLSIGALDAILGRVGQALAAPYADLRAALPSQPVVYADETGWALAGRRRWLWGGFTPTLAVFALSESRSQQAASQLLGAQPAGIVCSDRWSGYNHLPAAQRQVCWSHLARDFQAISERPLAADQRLGQALTRISSHVFHAYQAYRDHQDPTRLQADVQAAQQRLRKLLEPVAHGRRQHTAAFARDLLKRWPSLWTFATCPDLVEPTNNRAERGLRPAVIKRKLSFGNHSEHGLRTTERLLSAEGSCRLQQRSLYRYLSDLLTAQQHDTPLPSLLPA